jgi:phosphate starvation-inducible PhoH-like protein
MTKRTRLRLTKTETTPRPLVNKAVHIQPKTANQDRLLRAIETSQLIVTIGPAGVGKTWCAVNAAVNLLVQGKAKTIILTRANIPTGPTLGSFPGDIGDKLGPWLAPMVNVIKQRLGVGDYDTKKHSGQIQFQPLETIRGASYENAVILVDEAQNLSYEEVKAVTTRIGENSKMVLMGDPMQRDTRDSGLVEFKKIINKYDLEIPIVEFTVDDIVRSDIVAVLVKAFIKHEKI